MKMIMRITFPSLLYGHECWSSSLYASYLREFEMSYSFTIHEGISCSSSWSEDDYKSKSNVITSMSQRSGIDEGLQ